MEAERAAGDKSNVALWFPGCPVRMPIGGVGTGRMLSTALEPALWPTWEALKNSRRDVRCILLECVDTCGNEVGRMGQRAKPSSQGGNLHVFV